MGDWKIYNPRFLTPLVVNPFGMVGLLNWVTTTSLISSMEGLEDTYSSNGGRYCFMEPEEGGRKGRGEGERDSGRRYGRGEREKRERERRSKGQEGSGGTERGERGKGMSRGKREAKYTVTCLNIKANNTMRTVKGPLPRQSTVTTDAIRNLDIIRKHWTLRSNQ